MTADAVQTDWLEGTVHYADTSKRKTVWLTQYDTTHEYKYDDWQ